MHVHKCHSLSLSDVSIVYLLVCFTWSSLSQSGWFVSSGNRSQCHNKCRSKTVYSVGISSSVLFASGSGNLCAACTLQQMNFVSHTPSRSKMTETAPFSYPPKSNCTQSDILCNHWHHHFGRSDFSLISYFFPSIHSTFSHWIGISNIHRSNSSLGVFYKSLVFLVFSCAERILQVVSVLSHLVPGDLCGTVLSGVVIFYSGTWIPGVLLLKTATLNCSKLGVSRI